MLNLLQPTCSSENMCEVRGNRFVFDERVCFWFSVRRERWHSLAADVACGTAETVWGVQLARQLGAPVLGRLPVDLTLCGHA